MRARKTALLMPGRTFGVLCYMRPALLAFILLSVLFLGGGCSQDQLGLAAQQTASLQTKVELAQQQLKDLQLKIDAERAVLTTQPATTQAASQLAKDEEKAKQISVWLDKAKPVIDQLAKATDDVAHGQPPNFTGLSDFGPYGILAALALSVGWGAWSTYQSGQKAKVVNAQAQTIAAQQPVIDHIQEATGTTNPVSAAAALTNAFPVLGVSTVGPIQPVEAKAPVGGVV